MKTSRAVLHSMENRRATMTEEVRRLLCKEFGIVGHGRMDDELLGASGAHASPKARIKPPWLDELLAPFGKLLSLSL